jgi:hypothetical protein
MTTQEHPTTFRGLPSRSIFYKGLSWWSSQYRLATYGETGPLSEDLGVRDLDELDVVLGTKSLDELEVLG